MEGNTNTGKNNDDIDERFTIDKNILKVLKDLALKWCPVLKFSILGLIGLLSIITRVFSVIRYESIIHEFDPWFNYRTTQFISSKGFYEFWNWFDADSWYPLGRVTGGTTYPGLMSTAAIYYWVSHFFGFPVEIRNVCVFLAPVFSSLFLLQPI